VHSSATHLPQLRGADAQARRVLQERILRPARPVIRTPRYRRFLPLIAVTLAGAPVRTGGAPAGVVLVGAGDIASCARHRGEATARLLDTISGTVFTAGDNAYPKGTLDQYLRCYDPTWGRHKARTRPSPGNHDYATPGAAGYFRYFGAAAGDSGRGYYSYELGAWHIVVLNSNVTMRRDSAQERWLRADLATESRRCTLAYWHHPLFSSGTIHGGDRRARAVWRDLYAAGADVVVNGHEHNYERFAPMTPAGAVDSARGIREFVVGTGGESHFPFGAPLAASEARNDATFGVLQLTLYPDWYAWRFIPVEGATFSDSGRGTCH